MDPRRQLLEQALSYPEAWEDHPWGESVVKVRKKVFVFLGVPEDGHLGCSLKLPESGPFILAEDFAEPTGYGLGKSGWVSLTFAVDDPDVPLDLLFELIDESYRAVAPKTLVKQLDTEGLDPH
jgi:predicted DNA-binding protein (MmcQ/YjbR family)